ncbi:MAG: NusG domain II-containing protein [Clostridia bacterium]
MKKADYWIILAVAVLSLLPLLWFFSKPSADTVLISQHGETVYSGSLEKDATITLDGNVITIKDAIVTMTSADCPDKTCMQGGPATSAHPIVCLPNEVIVTITGEEAPELDGISY